MAYKKWNSVNICSQTQMTPGALNVSTHWTIWFFLFYLLFLFAYLIPLPKDLVLYLVSILLHTRSVLICKQHFVIWSFCSLSDTLNLEPMGIDKNREIAIQNTVQKFWEFFRKEIYLFQNNTKLISFKIWLLLISSLHLLYHSSHFLRLPP